MADDGWSSALVLGGIRSGKSAFAESLVAEGLVTQEVEGGARTVRYVATGRSVTGDTGTTGGAGDRHGRPESWSTEELSGHPDRLAAVVAEAKADEAVLVDDLGGWVAALLEAEVGDDTEGTASAIAALAEAARTSAGRVVLVSPEVGLSVVPATHAGRLFADILGTANRVLADACAAVVLVVAGQPVWLKGGPAGAGLSALGLTATGPRPGLAGGPGLGTPADVAGPAGRRLTRARPVPTLVGAASPTALDPGVVFQPGMDLPMPDEAAATAARTHLATLDLPGAGLGALAETVAFAAATQGRAVPQPWQEVRVLLLHADHDGGAAAGDSPAESARRAARARAGEDPVALLAAEAGASLRVVEAMPSQPFETEDALTTTQVDEALAYGWRLAAQAADSGVDLLVMASYGAGAEAAAAAVVAAASGAEVAKLLGRVVGADGHIDDAAWMVRCAAVRDALHRTRSRQRGARDLLAALGGADLAVATGILLGAAARRTPVLLDGPVGIAAGLVSRDLGGQARHWCLLPDDGGQPTVRYAADVLNLRPVMDLRLGLGEGATALAALPLLRAALTLAGTVPVRPPAPEPVEPVEPPAPEPKPTGAEPARQPAAAAPVETSTVADTNLPSSG
ncbi:MAG TPA: bifunctional adenosylcobinamide kinase/adenosylcobinamide-phosphate guanylyltransferase [Micromonosporaceae bacterium]|nr:bifunctional adenosylcobinamide kinase/adenosylcobinamide-phosphate guanylyltransferase [Micromonosporaceae bacterium]